MIVKILAFITAVLCTANCMFFTYCGFVALQQGSIEHVVKSIFLVFLMAVVIILCVLELTSE